MDPSMWTMFAWIVGAGILGTLITGFFAGRLELSRNAFLIPYVGLVVIFETLFVVLNHVDIGVILQANLVWGILAAALDSVILVINVRSYPSSRQARGVGLALDILWPGVIYGFIDGLFLNAMPVVAAWLAFSQAAWASSLAGKVGVAAIGLVASLLVAVLYHVGYPEFRSKKMRMVVIGNTIITLAVLLSGNPLGGILAHTVMHVAAVLHGPETTVQLPPHYPARATLRA